MAGEESRIILQAVLLASLVWAAGGVLYTLALGGRSACADRSARRATALAVMPGCLSLAALIPMQLIAIGGDWGAAIDPLTLELWADSLGASAGLRAAGLLLIAAWLTVWRWPGCALAGLGAVILSFAFTGHAVSHEPSWLLRAALVIHFAAAALWLGALAPLRAAALQDEPGAAARLMDAFAIRAIAGLSALLAGGAILSSGLSGAWPWEWIETDWGRGLLFKLAGVAALLAFAVYHRFVLTGRLRRGEPQAGARLARSIGIELLIALGVVAATASFAYRFSP